MLSLFAQAIERLGDNVAQYVPRIMEAVFECTLVMITRNFEVGGRNKGFHIACKGGIHRVLFDLFNLYTSL